MAKDIREVIALEEKFAAEAQNSQATAWLESLRIQIAFGRRKGYLRARLPKLTPENPGLPQPETPTTETVTFIDQEREALLGDGAVLYLPAGETIRGQIEAGREFGYVFNGGERLLDFPSRRIEVAIYPDPERFFVPGSFNKTTDKQDALMEQDAESLRKRLCLGGITMVRPEAPEVTEVIFKHFDATQVRLLGKDYMEQAGGYYPYIRTSTPTNKTGSVLADVGHFAAGYGPHVGDWHRDDRDVFLAGARWVVPQRSR
ncbi:MAG: hypothetical protein Q7S88_00385 [Candidatus Daviesbacteria bacterium]|nr:hypothetical protein [Candidatus Daviesbacteria bacterium]